MKKNLNIIIWVILIVCSLNSYSLASNIQNLAGEQSEIQKQKEEVNEQLEKVKQNLSVTMLNIEELHQKIEKKEDEIRLLNIDIENLEESIKVAEQNYENAKDAYEKQKRKADARLITVYEAGETTYLDVLLKSNNLSDLISNYYLITEIVQKDTQMLEDLEKEKKIVEIAKETLEMQKEKIITLRNNSEKSSDLLSNMLILKNNYINQLSTEEKKLQEKIDTYDAEIKRIDAEIYAITSTGENYKGGIMLWPVSGYYTITSAFGYRVHPIFGIQRFHSGLDVAVPIGTPVLAANSGTIIRTAYSSSYGNMVMLDHGGGIVTVYAHLSEFVANVGDIVEKGDVIAKSGSTGWSTGPHLHFEVRINGQYVDPGAYLKGDQTKTEENTENNVEQN